MSSIFKKQKCKNMETGKDTIESVVTPLALKEVDRRRRLSVFPQDNNFAVAGEWTCSSSFCLLHPDNLPTVSSIHLKNVDKLP